MVMPESNVENEYMAFGEAVGSMLVDGLLVHVCGNPVEVIFPTHLTADCVNGSPYKSHGPKFKRLIVSIL